MKRISLLVVLLFAVANFTIGQVTEGEEALRKSTADSLDGWKKGGAVFLNSAQSSLTHWAAGGAKTSIAVNGLVNLFANYTKGSSTWDNTLDLGYGKITQEVDDDILWVKTDDKIDLMSKYGQKAAKSWYYAALFNFKTQMDKGYNSPKDSVAISKFLAPAYILCAIGMDYKPSDVFTAFIAPLTGKFTIVNDQVLADAGAFGVDSTKKSRAELGGYIRVAFKKDLMENVNLASKIDFFSNYLKNPDCIDINWETLLTLKVNKYISASLATLLIYDDDIVIQEELDNGVRDTKSLVQFKEVLSVGFTMKF